MAEYVVVTEAFVSVFITSNLNSFTSEKRFAKDITVADLKGKLELITGGSSGSMKLSVFDKEDKKICELGDGHALLGSFPIDNGNRIHVQDSARPVGEFENLANVQKFELSKEEYAKKSNTVQSFLKQNKMGKYNAEEMKRLEEEKTKAEEEDAALAAKMKSGDRCQVQVAGSMTKRGTVRFVGKVHFQSGWWVGVQYDEPLGKNDGSVDGKSYFTCQDKYGGFVKVANVEVGDFPEEDLGLSDDEM